ncbi:hypothetical protein [Streptomyces caniscabiei]|uniref:Integral membrane protein n=1 Tax=Streptomyces caniscabiei TaxID=2746961 RepID=A0ABU4N4L8_9ACTN|nr:hypothetical protein [Streptomyces caniscabiei]MBE4739813.1 hypothetical protein [Streptomyces caniscabiei]MBE4758703.1 hypothetical protein [Streptomyces caniscabiei]MBE4797554.1 hypothetical protein [Streptomyces caniscabiei]MDX2944845.1 hypothetical protein [Streptomyces caniscabiei]MDX2988424.1 hypothetical protein [Streptomyces caniscabiei]
MTTPHPSTPPTAPDSSSPEVEPLLSQRAVVVFLAAAFVGAVVGVLTYFSAGQVAAALLAGLTGFGTSTLGLHKLIGN